MKVITYFMFTILSIFIQFCVMDFIQGKMQIDKKLGDLSRTSQKVQLSNMLKNISNVKPQALYYNIKAGSLLSNNASIPIDDLQLVDLSVGITTTDDSSSIFDLYDENSSVTESAFTTELVITSTEYDNVTEVTLFMPKKEPNVSKTILNEDCNCNFLYKVCDVNCCCDSDCSDTDRRLFSCFRHDAKVDKQVENCFHFLPQSDSDYKSHIFNDLFCIVKTNLPDRRILKQEKIELGNFYKWKELFKPTMPQEFTKTFYKEGDFIWLLKKDSVQYMDIPSAFINNYCMGRQPIKFLKRLKANCNVELKDLEMLHILNMAEEWTVISPLENSLNSTALNCTTLYCAPWNITACDRNFCVPYNKKSHEPMCTEDECTNIASRIDLLFYYHDMKITNVSVKFYMQKIPKSIPFVTQEMNVDFFLGNISMEHVLEFSGSPGYIIGRPIIMSYVDVNHTDHLYKGPSKEIYFRLPDNINGLCIMTNNTNNFILFGVNKRTKCRYIHTHSVTGNYTAACRDIQENIKSVLGLKDNMFISPYGNPYNSKDDQWINVQSKGDLIGPIAESDTKYPKVKCYNIASTISLVFAYADLENKNENKILLAEYEIKTKNMSFHIEDNFSSVVTIDINFIDATKPGIDEYASGPHLNIGLPKGFFYPFSSNKSNICHYTACEILIYCILIFVFK